MSIIKEKIKFNNQDINLKITLGGGNRLSGYQQEIDDITEETKDELINPIIDNEIKRFSYYNNGSPTTLKFYFTANGSNYYNDFLLDGARFTKNEIGSNDLKALNSFFIIDIYDEFNNYTQTKISTTYLTKISDGESVPSTYYFNGALVTKNIGIPTYIIDDNTINQLYRLPIPKSFLDKQTGSTVTGYIKFSFYNGKYGDVALFYNKANSDAGIKTPEKMYFTTILDLEAQTWKFSTISPTAYQLPFTNNYSERTNDAVENFDNEQHQYPEGNTFIDDGTYEVT